jgi:signal transduction histidine kinase
MINVNKLFRRLTIRSKLVIAFVLLGVVPLLVVGGYGAVFSFSLRVVVVVGGLVLATAITVGMVAASHFTKPILELGRGAEIVAAGDFDYSIKAETNDEIEDLAHSFNLMTHKLKEHEGQLRDAHEKLEMKAREAEALYRLGTEISAFLDLDKILHLVAEKARELLGSDIAALGLVAEDGQEFVVGATSGPSEAFSFGRGRSILGGPDCIGPCTSSNADGEPNNSAFACPVIRGDYLKAHLAVPLKTRDKVIGALCVGTRASREFIKEDIDLLSGLASQAAIAIENARLHRQVRSLAALEERERISKDLHDGIIQSIYATGLGLEDGIQLVDEDPGKAKQRLEQAIEDLNDVIKDVRNYIFNLQPEVLYGKEIGQALADLVKGFKINSLVDAELVVGEGIDGLLSQEQKKHLFHIAREALANVAKHAGASKVSLELLGAPDGLTFSLEDNGVGLDSERARTGGQGLRNIAERVKLLGGDCEIKSGVRKGTCLVVMIPVGESPQRAAISSQQEKLVS